MFDISPLFFLAALMLNITPGPDMLYVIARSVSQGRTAGIISSLGIAAGCFVHIAATVFGLSSLLIVIPAAFNIIKYAGAAYLVYLGIRTLMQRSTRSLEQRDHHEKNLGAIFRQGAFTNILNPKVALFFLAFLPQFVDHTHGNLALQFIVLGVLFNIGGTIVNVLVSVLVSSAGSWMKDRLGNSPVFRWISGTVFIGLGLRLAFLERR